jgi:transposase
LPVAIVNPRQVRKFAGPIGRLAKTDAIDAGVSAYFADAIRPAPKPMPNDLMLRLRELLARRRQLGTVDRHQIAALAGVAPMNRDSGRYRGKRHIQGGRVEVRAALYGLPGRDPAQPATARLLLAAARGRQAMGACPDLTVETIAAPRFVANRRSP